MAEPVITVVVVNYRKAARVVENIAALRRQTIADRLRVVVVDNSVDAGEAAILRDGLRDGEMLVVASANLGYTKGVNLGARAAAVTGDVLLLNPDIIVDRPDALEILAAELAAAPEIGVLGTLQRNDDGSLVEVARRFPSLARLVLRRLMPGRLTDHDLLDAMAAAPAGAMLDVDWVQSSFTLVRAAFWQALGGLDERYAIFMADVALGREAHRRGWRVAVTSSVCVRADGQRASGGGVRALATSRALRVHVRDAFVYQLLNLRPLRRTTERAA